MFRSQSGPGGLSINTTSANSVSSSSTLPPPSGGKSLFGSLATSTAPAQTSTLFSTPTAVSQPQTSSLFGNPQTQSQGPQAQPSLFGSQSTQQPQGGGLFGNTAPPTQSVGSGLFGSQQARQTSSNIFGNSTQPQSQTGGGLFGSIMGQEQSQPTTNSTLAPFGNQNKPSLFGTNQSSVQNQQPPIPQAPAPSIFSATIGQHTQQQQTVPGVRISVNELRPTTRFNDLHEELQKAIEHVDNFIGKQMEWQNTCKEECEKIDNMCLQMPPDVQFCTNQLSTLQQALENDAETIAFAKSLVKADAADAKLSLNVIQNLRLPPQFHQTNIWGSTINPQPPAGGIGDDENETRGSRNLVDYFSKQTDAMSKSLDKFKHNITDIEEHLQGVESNTAQQVQQLMFTGGSSGIAKSAEDQVRELAAVLRAFESGILGVATKVGSARENVQDVMLEAGNSNVQGVKETRFGVA